MLVVDRDGNGRLDVRKQLLNNLFATEEERTAKGWGGVFG